MKMPKLKNWIWLVLVIAIAMSAIAAQTSLRPTVPPASDSETIRVQNNLQNHPNQATSTPNQPILSVSPQLLFQHVKTLAGQRYTELERAKVRNYLTTELRKLGWQPQRQRFHIANHRGTNIYASRSGKNPNLGTILVTAHFDTVPASPGADDNGTGVAVGLEIARLFRTYPTERNLQLAFFDSEEVGLVGSRAFANQAQLSKPIEAVINMDMVGYACHTPGCQDYPSGLPLTPPNDKGDFLVVVGDTEHLPLLDRFQSSSQPGAELEVFRLPVPFKGALTPDTMRSDHAPFWLLGKGAVLITDTANLRNPHYHQPSDRLTIIDREFFHKSAQLIVNTTLAILNQTEPFATPKPNL